ncbi:NUDIX domain-containing protein [Cereibacter changlensis]|uniref:NUDIX domain-containing protein n=1 Tax=Cereibacter changlensis TaxID=402884 RepID=UPI00403480B0
MGKPEVALNDMEQAFLYGPLRDDRLRAVVLGCDRAGAPALLADHALLGEGAVAALAPHPGGSVEGLALALEAGLLERLDFYQRVCGLEPMTVGPGRSWGGGEGPLWDAWAWGEVWAATVRATAGDVMRLFGRAEVAAVRARYPLMLVRGGSRARAEREAGATAVRRAAAEGDLRIASQRQPYARFFAVEEYDIAFRQFGGGHSETVTRAVFLSGDAVTVLPYDPVRDRVLLVEQFRPGPFARGDRQPWLLEAIAGRIDAGETPEAAARREAVEEAGLTLGALLPVGNYYPSPAAKAEYLYSYLALCDLPDDAAGVFGVEGEAEDIRGHLVGFDALLQLMASGEICNAPLMLSVLWLQRERAALRAGAA